MKFERFIAKVAQEAGGIKFVKDYAERSNGFGRYRIENILNLSYKLLKRDLPTLMEEGKFEEAIHRVLQESGIRCTFKQVKRGNNYEKLKFLFWIHDQYDAVCKMEVERLSEPPDNRLKRAGIDTLNILGDKNLIDSLAQGKIWMYDTILNMPYSEVFDKQYKTVLEMRISKKLKEIDEQEAKSKRKSNN
jgi:hypothetical protein